MSCDSFFQANTTFSMLGTTQQWYCLCQGNFTTVLLIIINTLFIIVGAPVQSWVFWMSLQGKIKPCSVFSLNLTVVELMFCFLCIITLVHIRSFSLHVYNVFIFFTCLSWTVRPLFQSYMCIEHYFAVIYPVTFLKHKSFLYRIAPATATWLFGVANSLRVVLFQSHYFPDYVFFLMFCGAVITSSFCCVSVLYALKRPGPGDRKQNEKHGDKMVNVGTAANHLKLKAFKIIAHILVSIPVCYFPLVVAFFMRISGINRQMYVCTPLQIILSVTLMNLLVSPLVRLYGEGQLKRIFCKVDIK